MNAMIKKIESVTGYVSKIALLLTVALIALVIYDTLARYLFSGGSVALQELEWHLFDALFLLGITVALQHDRHVRVDIFYEKYSPRTKALINIAGILFLLIPFSLFIAATGFEFAASAYIGNEVSPNPGGLEHRFIVKSLVPVAFLLLILQSIAEILKSIETLLLERK